MKLKMIILILIILLIFSCLSSKTTSNPDKVSFNRVKLTIPDDWKYSSNPNAVPGTDQLQLFSKDTLRTVQITVTNYRNDFDLFELLRMSSLSSVQKALSIPEYKDCTVNGKGLDELLWDRKDGLSSLFELIREESDEIAMKIYSHVEIFNETNEVLFITTFIIGEENPDYINIIKSMEILKK